MSLPRMAVLSVRKTYRNATVGNSWDRIDVRSTQQRMRAAQHKMVLHQINFAQQACPMITKCTCQPSVFFRAKLIEAVSLALRHVHALHEAVSIITICCRGKYPWPATIYWESPADRAPTAESVSTQLQPCAQQSNSGTPKPDRLKNCLKHIQAPKHGGDAALQLVSTAAEALHAWLGMTFP